MIGRIQGIQGIGRRCRRGAEVTEAFGEIDDRATIVGIIRECVWGRVVVGDNAGESGWTGTFVAGAWLAFSPCIWAVFL